MELTDPDGGCPEAFAACLTPEAAADLIWDVDALRRYAREAWILCGPRRGNGPQTKQEAAGAARGADAGPEDGAGAARASEVILERWEN